MGNISGDVEILRDNQKKMLVIFCKSIIRMYFIYSSADWQNWEKNQWAESYGNRKLRLLNLKSKEKNN